MSDDYVTVEVAQVYRANGRRYLSKRSAYYALARAIFCRDCECERGDEITPPVICNEHRDPVKLDATLRALAKELASTPTPEGTPRIPEDAAGRLGGGK